MNIRGVLFIVICLWLPNPTEAFLEGLLQAVLGWIFCPFFGIWCSRCDPDPCDHGACQEGSGQCVCEQGWEGDDCSLCSEGLIRDDAGECEDQEECFYCRDIDECFESDPFPCGENAWCNNTLGSYTCGCNDGSELDSEGDCHIIDPAEAAVVDDLLAGNSKGLVQLFPRGVFLQMVEDYSAVPGTIQLSNNAENYTSPFFEVSLDSLSDSIEIRGYFTPEADSAIPEDIVARIYFLDGLRASASVNPNDGSFLLVVGNVPYGVYPFIISFVSESFSSQDGGEGGRGRSLIVGSEYTRAPLICATKNLQACGPAFALTLSWSSPRSHLDLHVYEPDGTHLYYGNSTGGRGALFFHNDEIWGYGPQTYVASSVWIGESYQIHVELNDWYQDDFNWTLEAYSFGKNLWTEKGMFRFGDTPDEPTIPWIFETEPVCDDNVCAIDSDPDTRLLAGNGVIREGELCPDVDIPSKYPFWCLGGVNFIYQVIWGCEPTEDWKFYENAKKLSRTSIDDVRGLIHAKYVPLVKTENDKASYNEAMGKLDEVTDPACVFDYIISRFCNNCGLKKNTQALSTVNILVSKKSSFDKLKAAKTLEAAIIVFDGEVKSKLGYSFNQVIDSWTDYYVNASDLIDLWQKVEDCDRPY